MTALEQIYLLAVAAICICVLYALIFIMPVWLHADAECLRAGYLRAIIANATIGLERYCSTLDGAVTVKVIKQ